MGKKPHNPAELVPPDNLGAEAVSRAAAVFEKNPRLLATLDAYHRGYGSLADATRKAFQGPPYVPEGFSVNQFGQILLAIADRIHRGEIQIPDELRRKFREFYSG